MQKHLPENKKTHHTSDKMKKDKKGNIVMSPRTAAELFCMTGFARTKLKGKLRTNCEKFWKELERVLGLRPEDWDNIKKGK